MSKCSRHRPTSRLLQITSRLWRDEAGGEVIEWALIAGLISITAIAVIASLGTKVLARWTTINSSM